MISYKLKIMKYLLVILFIGKAILGFSQTDQSDNLYNEPFRPQYHFSREQGWMNDPCGLIYYQSQYHLYYWGHAVSTDLLHWRHRPKALEGTDEIGIMSGSAVIDKKNTSGFGTQEDPPVVAAYSMLRHSDRGQMQGIAYSNDHGRTFIPYKNNPVIDIGSTSFRDPQVFWHSSSDRWIMAVTLSGQRKVRFYSSENLKDWIHLSDFGPAGATGGVWECPDLFPLPVDGDSSNIKWVLEVDVQPVGGQYFLGSFDGKKFTMDSSFARDLENRRRKQDEPSGEVIFDFENTELENWKEEGTAFHESPAEGALPKQNAVIGFKGDRLINSFHQGDSTTGKITSPPFIIEKDYINFLYGGGYHPNQTCMNLLINGKVVRTQSGINTEALYWTGWDVSEYQGKQARVEILDQHTGGFGHITIDHIMQSDHRTEHEREKAFWIDYGPDFYAVRSWVNYPEDSNRRVWIAWMSNWLYANDIPTHPWKGFQSIPRSVQLVTFPEGVRLTQQPIKEIRKLRLDTKSLSNPDTTFEGQFIMDSFSPSQNTYEIIAEFDPGTAEDFGFYLCKGDQQKTIVGYNTVKDTLFVDRRHSGKVDFNPQFPRVSKGPLKNRNGIIKFHILVDQSSLEVFGNNGETVISSQIFPGEKSLGIELFSHSGEAKLIDFRAWELQSVWKNQKK